LEAQEGQRIEGRFTLLEKLGAGGFASVWRASDGDGADVAVKLLHPERKKRLWVIDRFVREARVLSELDHPNIARVVACRVEGDTPYIAMEYLAGRTLRKEIGEHAEEHTHFSRTQVVELFTAIAAAVEHAHERRIVHRDLKPENIMLVDARGQTRVKVLDFGLAKILGEHGHDATTVGRVLGTVVYMAPEQITRDSWDGSVDLFALGTMLFEVLTLRKAWAHDKKKRPLLATPGSLVEDEVNNQLTILERIVHGRRPRPSDYQPGISAELDALVLRSMAAEPEERPPSAAAFARELVQALGMDRAASVTITPEDTAEFGESSDGTAVRPVTIAGKLEASPTSTNAPPAPAVLDTKAALARPPISGEAPSVEEAPIAAPIAPPVPGVTAAGSRAPILILSLLVVALGLLVFALIYLRADTPTLLPQVELPAAAPVATPRPEADEVVIEEAAAPTPERRQPDLRRRPEPRPEAPPVQEAPAPIRELRGLLSRAGRDPANSAIVAEISDRVLREAGTLPPGAERTAIERRATQAAMNGDLAALEACVRLLAEALSRR